MKIEVYNENKDVVWEGPLRLRLLQTDTYVELVAVDAGGEIVAGGFLLRITNAGSIALTPHVNTHLGLQLDGVGRIKLEN